MICFVYLFCFIYSINSDFIGTYQNNSPQSCSIIKDITYMPDHTLIKRKCDGQNALSFGIWQSSQSNQIQEYYSDGSNNIVTIQQNNDNLIYNGVNLVKSNSNILNLSYIFGKFEANTGQDDKCKTVSKLEITNNGQILKYYCKGEQKDWFSRGFFKMISYDNNQLVIQTTFNGTSASNNIEIVDTNNIIFDTVKLHKA